MNNKSWSAWILPLLYLVGVSATLYFLLSDWSYDDPYITYRYAYNLAHGKGFIYNPGERVLSTTTPLFTLLLALLSPIFPNLPRAANLIGAISLALGALFLWDLAKSWKTPEVGWAALLFYPTFTLPATTLGSETPLYIALCLSAFAFYARQKYSLVAILAALTFLARPDGVLVLIVLAVDYLLRRQHHLPTKAVIPRKAAIPWKAVAILLCILLPWFIFAWIYFGYPLPITLAAKQQQSSLVASQRFLRGFIGILGWYVKGWQYWLEAILAALGVFWVWRQARAWLLLLSWTTLYFVAYAILQVPRYFWYYAPLVPGFIVLVGLGIAALAHLVREGGWQLKTGDDHQGVAPDNLQFRKRTKARTQVANILVLALLIPISVFQVVDLWKMEENPDRRTAVYRAVGEWLKENSPSEAIVSSLEVGIIGYYAERPMVDFAGLLQPDVAQQIGRSETYDEAAIWTMGKYSPDYVVLVKGDLRGLKTDYLDERCHITQRFPEETYGYTAINVYTCP